MVASPDEKSFKSSPVFQQISTALKEDGANFVKKVNGVFGFKVKGGPGGAEGYWVVDAKNGNGSVTFGGNRK